MSRSAPLLLCLLLAACQASGGGGSPATFVGNSDAAYDLSKRLAGLIGRCWYAAGETAFAGTVYSPERTAGQSRILIVKKNNPTGLPLLVVEAKTGATADVYGPLAVSATGARISADIERWTKGGEACA